MRFALILTGLFLSSSLGFAQTNRLLGAWELYSFDYGGQPKAIDMTEIKLYTDHHFVWVNYRSNGERAGIGGGTYSYSNPETVVEHIEFASPSQKSLLKTDEQVMIAFRGDDTYIATSLLKDKSGQRLSITEVWKRKK